VNRGTWRAWAALIVIVASAACRQSNAQESLEITIKRPSIALVIGETTTVQAVITVAAREAPVTVTWSSDNDAVARVDRAGHVTALSPGITGITARVGTAFASTRVSVSSAETRGDARTVAAREPAAAPSPPSASTSARSVPAAAPASAGSLAPVHRSPRSPHFSHISVFYTDFYSRYASPADRATTIAFLAPRLDGVMSGSREQWRAANSTIKHFRYTLLYTIIQPGQKGSLDDTFSGMQQWYASHPRYEPENAFLHRGGHDAAHRVQVKIWDSMRWAMNPSDEGQRAFQIDRIVRLAQNEDGVFLDEYGGPMSGVSKTTDEFATPAAYMTAETELIAKAHEAIKPKFLLINIAEYWTPADSAIVAAGGGAHLERTNFPFTDGIETRWKQIDKLMAMGVYTEFVTLWGYTDWLGAQKSFPTFSPGMYKNSVERGQLVQLANYYMAVPADPQRFSMDQQNLWNVRPDTVWEAAVEADVGHPREARHMIASGVDPAGQKYRIYARDFDHAYVVIRPSIDWRKQVYGDSTGVVVPLPAPMRLLHRDGSLGPAITSVTLRDVEAAILFK
jgi:hypothetical protein